MEPPSPLIRQEEEYWDGRGWTRAPSGTPVLEDSRLSAGQSKIFMFASVGVLLALLAGVGAVGAYIMSTQSSAPETVAAVSTPSAVPSVATAASPSPLARSTPTAKPASRPVAATPRVATAPPKLTATVSGSYCPVAYLNQNACWRGTVVNTGPQIGRLALIFVTGGGYTNWFSTHSSPALSGFYTTPGCVLDISHARMLCGAVPRGGHVTVYLSADTSKAGTFHYAVKFADVSYGTPDYIDQNPDGTHRIVAWTESIIA